MTELWQTAGFGLYVHWPFCLAKCPYCDFNSHVSGRIDQSRWKRAYLAEIARLAAETPGRVLTSVFLGGGTPSLMEPDLVAEILQAACGAWVPANDLEVTLEANPTSVEAGKFRAFHDAGVNRVSVGIQALRDRDLKALGRMHSVSEARAAFDIAAAIFERTSFDLIYARQNQSVADWQAELKEALEFAGGHLSLYQLTIEDGTRFGALHARGKLRGLPDEDAGADMYLATQEICEDAGYPAYEISNHARPGQESRHNLIYWRGGDYAGIGPGAHGRLTIAGQRWATTTVLQPTAWLDQVEATGAGEGSREAQAGTDVSAEYLMMGLRMREGVDLSRLAPDTRRPEKIEGLIELGLVDREGSRLWVTAAGRPVLNAVLRELLPDAL